MPSWRWRRPGSTCSSAEADRLIATALGDTLFTRRSATGAWVASEPTDDEPGWTEVADGSLVTITATDTTVVAL